MAVQQNRRTRATRGMRRAHDSLSGPCVSVDQETGEKHRRHHVSPEGFYKGRQVVARQVHEEVEE